MTLLIIFFFQIKTIAKIKNNLKIEEVSDLVIDKFQLSNEEIEVNTSISGNSYFMIGDNEPKIDFCNYEIVISSKHIDEISDKEIDDIVLELKKILPDNSSINEFTFFDSNLSNKNSYIIKFQIFVTRGKILHEYYSNDDYSMLYQSTTPLIKPIELYDERCRTIKYLNGA